MYIEYDCYPPRATQRAEHHKSIPSLLSCPCLVPTIPTQGDFSLFPIVFTSSHRPAPNSFHPARSTPYLRSSPITRPIERFGISDWRIMPSATKSSSSFTFIPQGAIIQEFRVGSHNIVQSFPRTQHFKDSEINTAYFGETIGRTTNRIKDGVIRGLNGKDYELKKNNGPNGLHGGEFGWGKKDWNGPVAEERNGREGVKFVYESPNGEEGYPGTVNARVWYTAWEEDGKTVLEAEYEVELVGDEVEETVVGVTNHRYHSYRSMAVFRLADRFLSYFNLSNNPTIEGTHVTLCTDKYLPIDATGIPRGNISSYPGTDKPFTLGTNEPDIDDCFVIDTEASAVPLDTRTRPLRMLAKLHHPSTGLNLEISSSEPAFQFYTGKYVDIPAVEGAPARGPRCGLCVEPSRYVNAANVPEWRSMCLLRKGQKWGAKSVYKAWQT